jgi:NAD(P)-dependent dehydrogenase (short-subunit alcohol dehydrogenase family)
MSWEGKTVIVTGSATGIGQATAKLFGEKGAKVVLFDVNEQAAANVDAIKGAGGQALFVRGDVSSEADVRALGEKTVAAFGSIDGLINNAGIMRRHEFAEWPIAEIRQTLDINLLGLFLTTYILGPTMIRDGGGSIINISSLGGLMPVVYSPVYAAAKAGVLGLTRAIAPTLGPQGVRVNAVLPSLVDTPLTANAPSRGEMPMMPPSDLAKGIFHVASDTSTNGGFFAVMLGDKGPQLSRLEDKPNFTLIKDL